VTDYDVFARFYDELMDDSADENAERVAAAIELHRPSATRLLELGCGTGAVLARLPQTLSLTGVDRSAAMLAHAAASVPRARLIEADMTGFASGERFDVVICVYDTLNHLPRFELWTELFGRVGEHLADGGLFVFDVNTTGRLRELGEMEPWVQDFDGRTMIMDIDWSEEKRSSTWDIRVFEPADDGHFELHHDSIVEFAVPLSDIKRALSRDFELLDEADPDGAAPTDDSARAYFVYQRSA
jgi:SAM-dependent methyltransferase